MTETGQGSTLGNMVSPGQTPHEPDFGTDPQIIETHIRQAREGVAVIVDKLVDRMRPANQTKALKDKALGVMDAAWGIAVNAIAGDDATRRRVGIAAGAITGLTLLTLRRRY